MIGTRKRADVILAGTDRVAIDAVGVAILKSLGSNKAIMDNKIFEQEQIARAAALGLGASGPDEIESICSRIEFRSYNHWLKVAQNDINEKIRIKNPIGAGSVS